MNRSMITIQAFVIAFFCISCQSAANRGADELSKLRVMTFNLWHGGDAVKLPRDTTIKYQLEAIRKAKADVVGFQEQTTNQSDNQSRAQLLADSLGWQCHIVDGSRAMISKYGMKPIGSAKDSQAVLLQLSGDKEIVFGVMHLMYTPYEPYDIADKKLLSTEAAEASARETRLHQVQGMLDEIAAYADLPTVLVGDFNEPSCLDWTEKAIEERGDTLLPFAVNWPATALLIEKGFKDAYREVYPDIKQKPAYTWTSVEGLWRTPEIHDRIDLIYVSEDKVKVTEAQIVGEPSPMTDMAIDTWPSDHRAVVVELELR
ncbi:endonuclease/exonuclease/phosphatase family protein [Parapedobacter pyrenivorans]|uniref:endonuclease/exonuclease/phosphatase family protein n=1 Tax=Parapedobacter pyrenivorans TaxID=1305674 RepID=UPI0033421A0F